MNFKNNKSTGADNLKTEGLQWITYGNRDPHDTDLGAW